MGTKKRNRSIPDPELFQGCPFSVSEGVGESVLWLCVGGFAGLRLCRFDFGGHSG
jgi:hypothetical protein